MKVFTVYDNNGKILRGGFCSDLDFLKQANDGEFVMEGRADDVTQKIIDGKIFNKTQEEIEAEKPPEIPFEIQAAFITNEQWQKVLNRLEVLEAK